MVVNQNVTLSWNSFKINKFNVFQIGWLFVIKWLWKNLKTLKLDSSFLMIFLQTHEL